MRQSNRYNLLLAGTALRLFQQDGIRDPSIVEIGLAVIRQPPPDHPAIWPDNIGGELLQGVSKRLAEVRALLDQQGYQCAPIGAQYYTLGMRGRVPEDYEAQACIPTGGPRQSLGSMPIDNRPYGIRFVIDGEEDPIYAAYIGLYTGTAAGFGQTMNDRLRVAYEKGVVTQVKAVAIAERANDKLATSPTELVRITRGGGRGGR